MSDYRISLNVIPNDWKICRFKFCYNSKKEIVGDKFPLYDRLALTLNGVIKRSKNDDKGLQPKDFKTYQILRKNDMVFKMIHLQNMSTSRVGRTLWDGIVSPAYLRFEPLYKDPGFMYFYFMSLYYNNVFNNIAGDEVRSALNAFDIGNIYCAFPPLSIQNRIVETLSTKIGKIDELIANEDKQIEKLEEYKKALITKAVTKGLDSNAKMKDSGVEWIGEIPEKWKLLKVKFLSTSIDKGNGITKDQVFDDGDIQCIRYGEIYTRYNNSFEKTFSRTKIADITSPVYLNYGDILCAGTGELVEEIGKNVVYMGTEPCVVGGDIIIVRHKINPIFFNYALNCQASQFQKSYGKAKLKVVHVSAFDIANVMIALPSMNEQQQIADYLDNKSEKINRIKEIKKSKIEKLQAYKKSLIYEYVTGKKEVAL